MIKLYDSAFSPFARKVRMTLEYKGLNYEAVDGLLKANHAALKAVNGRVEVPSLVDDGIVIVNSADIVAYLDYRYPAKRVCPDDPAARVHARAWERVADTFVDPILVNISYWKWAERLHSGGEWTNSMIHASWPSCARSASRKTPPNPCTNFPVICGRS